MTPEGKMKERVKRLLKKYKAYYFMPVQNGMGKMGLDFHCVYKGKAFFIETKAPGKKMTDRQYATAAEMELAGGVVFTVADDGDLEFVEDYLKGVIC